MWMCLRGFLLGDFL
ncbi:hypothetical protein LINPERPRIM_LOCUS28041 [Linum perenne]